MSTYSFSMFKNNNSDTDIAFNNFELQILVYVLMMHKKQFERVLLKEMGSNAVKALHSLRGKLESASGNSEN